MASPEIFTAATENAFGIAFPEDLYPDLLYYCINPEIGRRLAILRGVSGRARRGLTVVALRATTAKDDNVIYADRHPVDGDYEKYDGGRILRVEDHGGRIETGKLHIPDIFTNQPGVMPHLNGVVYSPIDFTGTIPRGPGRTINIPG